ncbi:NAD-dependent epimerase/dehydratase family protein [Rhodococcus sp. BP-241]|uniref:NAD-dependent epimerase/dehydratase family protein n=1 Tax=Rhodococcus sp. BP-241 TaxID=2739441 RepID=UPI001C9A6DF5|nr:NAD-dependent epimerase/dehydratase family protein [Rhodococcus sp. BP-241]MBY6707782.1 NAD-dependent epimerase/dehydratase family protein [Rhodococcus sp. BP-241]
MSDRHVVVGAGPVGSHVARLLADRGSEVVLVSRRGTAVPGVTAAAADASDADALSALTEGARALYNCANPGDYTQWQQMWPPLARSLRSAAERTGAVLAVTGNLYPYGPVADGVMREGMPDAAADHKGALRAQMWRDLADAHRAGTLRAVEVRGSDYVGTGVGANGHVTRLLPAALDGKAVWAIDAADVPHSFTDVLDEARALIAAVDTPESWGQVWHAPTNPAVTLRQAITDTLEAVGKPPVPVRVVPRSITRAAGLAVPMLRELNQLSYQRTAPYVLESTRSQQMLGIEPTPWAEVCRRTAQV